MSLSFHGTVSALVYSFVRRRCPHKPGLFLANQVARFLLRQHARAADYLRWPLRLATLLFDAASLPATGHAFHRLGHERRWRQIRQWQRSPLGFCRDLMQFYETLAVYCWNDLYDELCAAS